MKAYLYEKYGLPDVLELREIEKPVAGANQILVRIRATSVNPAEWHVMTGLAIARIGSGLFKPKDTQVGADYAGVVEAVGSDVTEFRPGDEVFGGRNGAFAEYVTARADRAVVHKPANVTFEQAASVPIAALTALQGLRDYGKIKPGQQVLINGASGGVGTFAVQIAKAMGAEVTGVCSPQNVALIRSLGADHVVDYTREDFTRSNRRYDLVLDIAGSRSWSEYRRVLKPKANFVIVGSQKERALIGPLSHMIEIRLGSLGASQKVSSFMATLTKEDLLVMKELMEAGKVIPVIDRRYTLSELPEAMRYLGEGHARGKIVVSMDCSAAN